MRFSNVVNTRRNYTPDTPLAYSTVELKWYRHALLELKAYDQCGNHHTDSSSLLLATWLKKIPFILKMILESHG